MNKLIPFTFETSEVRVVSRDNEPWFILADVCRVLELENPRNVTARLDDDEKGVHIVDTPGGPQEMTVVNESGLYSLILTSRKAAAKRFKKWVTAEVLPTIRKTGSYGAVRDPLEVLNDPSAMRGLLLTYSEKVLTLQGEVDAMRPDVEALERIARAEGSFNITLAAKTLQLQPKLLFQWLSHHRWIYRRAGGKCWIGYQDKIEAGLIEHKTTTFSRSDGSDKTVEQVLITPKGLTKLARIFAQLPLSDFPPAFYGGSQALAH